VRWRADRRRLAARLLLLALVALAAMPGYLALRPAWRPVAVRLACAALAAVACARAVRWARAAAGPRAAATVDAPPPAAERVHLDPRFVGWYDDVRAATRHRRYFDVMLWPRLTALGGADLPCPERPRRGGRGPSPRALARLVEELERRA
jgi:hypothetical protein